MKSLMYLLNILLICLIINNFTYGQNQNKKPLSRISTIYKVHAIPDGEGVIYPAIGQQLEYSNNLYKLQKEHNHLIYLNLNQNTIIPNQEYEIKIKIGMLDKYTFLGSMRFIANQDGITPEYNATMPLMVYLSPEDAPSYGEGPLWIELFDKSGKQLDSYRIDVLIY